jgi:hypothetical protein
MSSNIGTNDVLLGRGGKTFRHTGNIQLRDLARTVSKRYYESTKLEKSQISRELVNTLQSLDPPGRFLKKVSMNEWEEVDDVIAREKASQCLRDAVTELMKNEIPNVNQTQDDDDVSFENQNNKLSRKEDLSPNMNTKSSREPNIAISNLTPTPVKGQINMAPFTNHSLLVQKGHIMDQQTTFQCPPQLHNNMYAQNIYIDYPFTNRERLDQWQPYSVRTQNYGSSNYNPYDANKYQQQHTVVNQYPDIAHAQFFNPLYLPVPKPENSPSSSSLRAQEEEYSCAIVDIEKERNTKVARPRSRSRSNTSPDEKLFSSFFHDIELDITKSTSLSPTSATSPEKKKARTLISFDVDDFDLLPCHSTSHSIDSIDSFTKPL